MRASIALTLMFSFTFYFSNALGASAKKQVTPNLEKPLAVANYLLKVFKRGDVKNLVRLFNKAGRKKVSRTSPAKLRRIIRNYMLSKVPYMKGVKQINELREGPSWSKGGVMAKLSQVGKEVFVFILTREGKKYLFEDVNSPSLKDYLKSKLIWKRKTEVKKAPKSGTNPGSPKDAIALQLQLIRAGNAAKLRSHFIKRQQQRITKRVVLAAQREIKKYTLNTLVHTIRYGTYKGHKTAKIKMKNGRTLTMMILKNNRWLAGSIWFK